jgi:transcriptional regulator with XRE-family HTH domain
MPTRKHSTQPQEGADLRKWREQAGVNQSELARRAGIKQSLLSRLESGERDFTKDSSEKIYKAVKELNAERAERLTAIALNRDLQGVALEELLADKKTPARELKRALLVQHEQLQSMREQLKAYQQKEQRELEPLFAAFVERNVKPLTEKMTEQNRRHAEEMQAAAQSLVALKTEMEEQVRELQQKLEQIEQRTRTK